MTSWAGSVLAAAVGVTAVWAWLLMRRSPAWLPELRGVILFVGLAAAVGLLLWPWIETWGRRVVLAAAILASLAGPAAYTLDTVATPHSGAIPSAGPAVTTAARLGPGGGFGPGGGVGPGRAGGAFAGGAFAGGPPPGAIGGGFPGGRAAGTAGGFPGWGRPRRVAQLQRPQRHPDSLPGAKRHPVPLDPGHRRSQRGRRVPAGHQPGRHGHRRFQRQRPHSHPGPVPEVGGRRHRPLLHRRWPRGGPGGGPGTSGAAAAITSWVEAHFSSSTVGGVTVYDLAARTGL